jgi:hypothetical protein
MTRARETLQPYGVGPFGLEPLVLGMMITSSGDAGTRGAAGAQRMEEPHANARRHGECFRTGRFRPV